MQDPIRLLASCIFGAMILKRIAVNSASAELLCMWRIQGSPQ